MLSSFFMIQILNDFTPIEVALNISNLFDILNMEFSFFFSS